MSQSSRQISVCIGRVGRRVGTLWFESRPGGRETSVFQYDAEWLDAEDSFPIAPGIPLNALRTVASKRRLDGVHSRALPGPISDACPDAWGQRLLTADAGRGLTDIDYLLGVDDFSRMGALRFKDETDRFQRPQEDGRPIVPPIFELSDLQHAAHALERNDESREDLRRLLMPGSSLGGARPKCSVVDEHGQLHIAKFTSALDGNQSVERAEAMALNLARVVGITAPDARLIVVDRSPVAVIARFDRDASGNRFHYVSAQTFLGVETADEGSYTMLAAAIREHRADVVGELHELFRRLAFTILISNTDDHLKNHGFLFMGQGGWGLSPIFDVNPQPLRHRELKTAISEASGYEASIEAAIEVSDEFDLSKDDAALLIRETATVINENWRGLARRAGMTQRDLRYYAPAFEHEEMRFALSLSNKRRRPDAGGLEP